MTTAVRETAFSDLKLFRRGKVRDVYVVGEDRLLKYFQDADRH